MGIIYSLISFFSSSTEAPSAHAQTKSKRRRHRRRKRHHLLNRFFLGSKHFFSQTQPQTCLFNDYYYLNSRRDLSSSVQLQISLPDAQPSTIVRPIQCTVAVRRDSLKLIQCENDLCSIDFVFDADCPVQILIYFMAHEQYTNNHGSLSYTCCRRSDSVKQFYTFTRPAGHGQIFSSVDHQIRFPLSILTETHHNCTLKTRLYPIVILCREINSELLRNPSHICGTAASSSIPAPVFDQFHIVLATVRRMRLNETSDHVSIALLSQKHVYHGVIFKLFEFYGIENHPSNLQTTKSNRRRKPLAKLLPTSSLQENESFLHCSTEISPLKRSSSEVTISFIQSVDSPCVICLTDPRQVLLLPCRHLCICGSCAENLKFQSANCPICRVPFRALLQLNALHHRKDFVRFEDEEEELMYENIPLIDALNLATSTRKAKHQQHLTTNDIKYFCSEQSVSAL